MEKSILKFVWNCKQPQIPKTILRIKQVEVFIFPNSNIYHKAAIIMPVWYWHTDRHVNPWDRIESPEANPKMYVQLILNEVAKII